jgi:hypothetical protein
MRNKSIFGLVLFVVGFLAGFIPQYSKASHLQQEVSASADQVTACRSDAQIAQLRDAATLMYLEATEKNYGTSGVHAGRFFDQAQRLASTTQNQELRQQLREILATRDQITADLAKGDAAVVSEMQPIIAKMEQSAK